MPIVNTQTITLKELELLANGIAAESGEDARDLFLDDFWTRIFS